MNIKNLNITVRFIPAKVCGLVEEWVELHQDELLQMWETNKFHPIKPLV